MADSTDKESPAVPALPIGHKPYAICSFLWTKDGPDSMKIMMRSRLQIGVWLLGLGILAACDSTQPTQPTKAALSSAVPAEFQTGETIFNTSCSACHGKQATGTDHGPPLVHKVYEPNHHGDQAFQRAAANGVQAHHWQFGNMPKIEAVTPADVDQVVKYVRWLQRQAGIQ
jgi:mono/diheme cytochrome c family protein